MRPLLLLIDQLDDLIHNAKMVPLTDQARVNKNDVYDLLDEMRAALNEDAVVARGSSVTAEPAPLPIERRVLDALLTADPSMVDIEQLRETFGYVDVAVQSLVDDGLASRLGDGVGATRAAVRAAELSRAGAATA